MWTCARFRSAIGSASLLVALCAARGLAFDGPWPVRLNPFHSTPDPTSPLPLSEIANEIDRVSDAIRDDGVVVIKQPDVYSQSRLTRYRREFEDQMAKELDQFQFVLSARVNRLDAATLSQSTSLGAALAPTGTTTVNAPTVALPNAGPLPTPIDFSKTAFAGVTANQGAGGLGVEPTIYLDEKKRFLDHLNEIRRINMGPDQNDSSGYGLYLIRLPVSITPGERTLQGHGADLSVRLEHEFSPDFLPSTVRNLVVNDLVSQLGPVVFEVLRSDALKDSPDLLELRESKRRLEAQLDRSKQSIAEHFARALAERVRAQLGDLAAFSRQSETDRAARLQAEVRKAVGNDLANDLGSFIFRGRDRLNPLTLTDLTDQERSIVARRLDVLAIALDAMTARLERGSLARLKETADLIRPTGPYIASIAAAIRSGEPVDFPTLLGTVRNAIRLVAQPLIFGGSTDPHRPQAQYDLLVALIVGFYETVLQDDVGALDDAFEVEPSVRARLTRPFARDRSELARIDRFLAAFPALVSNLPSTRNPKQQYPIPPQEMPGVLLPDNIVVLAQGAARAQLPRTVRETDVRNWLRQSLYAAFDVMSKGQGAHGVPYVPPLLDPSFMDRILAAYEHRQFGAGANPGETLELLYDELVMRLRTNFGNIVNTPIGAMCWAVAIDAVLLDTALREDAARAFQGNGRACPDFGALRFYVPTEPARAVFHEYVRLRWPIITFALDPVTNEQNIADSFTLQRDLQLALSYAFATGQINFNQVNTFRRQLQLTADTIALNRTITGYAHGNDIFGFRFTPRYQNPPNQKTNIGVVASLLISGGPGPNYGLKKSKLEAGQRELTAIVLAPTFMTRARLEVASNWFKLVDPEHLIVPTSRQIELGRRALAVREAYTRACDSHVYREADLRVLQAKIEMLEAMLPQQSRVTALPFENTATGFELFSEGAAALVPELAGFEGVDLLPAGKSARIFIFGKYFNILDSHVIVGGSALSKDNVTIISREVMEVTLPSDAVPTVVKDGKSYLEIHVATPNGISNRLLVPVDVPPAITAPPPAVPHGYSLLTREAAITFIVTPGARFQARVAPDFARIAIQDSDASVAKELTVTFALPLIDNLTIPNTSVKATYSHGQGAYLAPLKDLGDHIASSLDVAGIAIQDLPKDLVSKPIWVTPIVSDPNTAVPAVLSEALKLSLRFELQSPPPAAPSPAVDRQAIVPGPHPAGRPREELPEALPPAPEVAPGLPRSALRGTIERPRSAIEARPVSYVFQGPTDGAPPSEIGPATGPNPPLPIAPIDPAQPVAAAQRAIDEVGRLHSVASQAAREAVTALPAPNVNVFPPSVVVVTPQETKEPPKHHDARRGLFDRLLRR